MKTLLKNLIAKTGYTLVNSRKLTQPQRLLPLKIKHFLDLYFSTVDPKTFFFVQIGAHDGKHHDPLYPYVTKYNLQGLALEPQKDIFKQLQGTYKNYPGVTCVNAAIGESAGQRVLYTAVGDSSLATFNKDVLPRGVEVQETIVDVTTFNDLVGRHKIKKIDFLQIDCEGYDFEILKMFDFAGFSPQIINFESVLFTGAERQACESLLTSMKYKFFRYERDTCAYKV